MGGGSNVEVPQPGVGGGGCGRRVAQTEGQLGGRRCGQGWRGKTPQQNGRANSIKQWGKEEHAAGRLKGQVAVRAGAAGATQREAGESFATRVAKLEGALPLSPLASAPKRRTRSVVGGWRRLWMEEVRGKQGEEGRRRKWGLSNILCVFCRACR